MGNQRSLLAVTAFLSDGPLANSTLPSESTEAMSFLDPARVNYSLLGEGRYRSHTFHALYVHVVRSFPCRASTASSDVRSQQVKLPSRSIVPCGYPKLNAQNHGTELMVTFSVSRHARVLSVVIPRLKSTGDRPALGGDEVRAKADAGLLLVLDHVRGLQHNLLPDRPRGREGHLRPDGLGGERRQLGRLRRGGRLRASPARRLDPLLRLQVRRLRRSIVVVPSVLPPGLAGPF